MPLADEEIARLISQIGEQPGAVAVNLLFSFANPDHEKRLADALRAAFPERSISVATNSRPSGVSTSARTTVIVDASLKRLVAEFVAEVDSGLLEQSGFAVHDSS